MLLSKEQRGQRLFVLGLSRANPTLAEKNRNPRASFSARMSARQEQLYPQITAAKVTKPNYTSLAVLETNERGSIATLAFGINRIDINGRPAGATPDREREAVIAGDAEVLIYVWTGTRRSKPPQTRARSKWPTHVNSDADGGIRHVEIGRPA